MSFCPGGMESDDEYDSDYDTLVYDNSTSHKKNRKKEPLFIPISAETIAANGHAKFADSPSDASQLDSGFSQTSPQSLKKYPYNSVTPKKEPLDDLRYAAVSGNLEVVKTIIKGGIEPDCILKSGWTALMYACSSAHDDIVQYLLEKGANPNFNKDSFTPLMAVCASRKQTPTLLHCCQLLLKHKAKVNVYERHLNTPLMFATREGHFEIIQELLDAGAEINAKDNKGKTALMWAASSGHGQIVRLFLNCGADFNATDSYGQTAADWALEHNYKEIAATLEKYSSGAVLALEDKNVDGEIQNKKFQSKMFPKNSIPQQPSKCYTKQDELEIFLKGLELEELISRIKEHKLTFRQLIVLNDDELQKIGINQLGVRKKILDASLAIQKERWKRSSLPHAKRLPYISCPDAVAMVANIDEHLEHISSQIVYIRLQIQAEPKILELAQDNANVHNLIEETEIGLKNVKNLFDELRFLKLYLNKIQGNNEFEPIDLIDETCSSNYHSQKAKVLFGICIVSITIGGILWKRPDSLSRINSFLISKINILKDIC